MENTKNLKRKSIHPLSIFLKLLVYFSAGLTFFILLAIIFHILSNGIPNLSKDLFDFKYTSENVSLMPALFTTIIIVILSLFIAIPVGLSTAIYMVEYAKKGDKIVRIVSVMTETLSGIPSIIYGLFGMIFFVTYLKLGYSIIAGVLTLSIMILPLITRTSQEALKSVPDSLREACYGLGAGKLRTIVKIVIPSSLPAILSGIILSIGRIVGESAALIFTAGTVAEFPNNVYSSSRTLAVHMYAISSEGIHTPKAYAVAVILLALVFFINTISSLLAKKLQNGGKN